MDYELYFQQVKKQILLPSNSHYLTILKLVFDISSKPFHHSDKVRNEVLYLEFLKVDVNKKISKAHFYKLLADLERMFFLKRSYGLGDKKKGTRVYTISLYSLTEFSKSFFIEEKKDKY